MFSLDSRNRKRSLRDVAASKLPKQEDGRRKSSRTAGPLDDVAQPAICLTGLTPEEKDKYHGVIEKLGGRYTRNLDSSVNTHLIARVPEGLKYEAALSIPSLKIVKPDWLDACAQKQKWVSTEEFLLMLASDEPGVAVDKEENNMDQLPALLPKLDEQLAAENDQNWEIFGDCNVFLVGMDDQKDVKAKLAKLLRRGMATIHWNLEDDITHVVVADGLEEHVRDAARLLTEQHPNYPSIVSPRWVLASLEKKKLADFSEFVPKYMKKVQPKIVDVTKPSAAQRETYTSLFKGSLFAFLRVSPPKNVVDYNQDDLEEQAKSNGGQILSQELVDALRADKARGLAPRKCYVVCWGAYDESSLSIHSLLAQMKKNQLGEVLQVTPMWMQTCIAERKVILPSRYEEIFLPPSRPIQKLQGAAVNKKPNADAAVRVCVTGYTGFRRKAMKFMLQAMGADYDDSLRPCTTHLICREASGSKYEKAAEWKIHTVSIEWLYHVAQFGFRGSRSKGKPGDGCEEQFSVSLSSQKQQHEE